MRKIFKTISLLIILLLLFYSFFSSNSQLFVCAQLILIAFLIGFGINCFVKKDRYKGTLYFVIALCNTIINFDHIRELIQSI
ncbi:hypothetical protein J9345_11790 [Bacillus subtilis subsp. subtilis]|uniref:hypothetical protein n=1 Tax=Bacillus TaxID=1386 RepID=UPI0015E7671E|nr:hypothetical protein [Bacillus subtilis]MBP3047339.1 hypothetical protein [Bacillus subtilis subsp. subtilis]UOX38249.1 hypothetical protein [Bacillus phage BUCT083]CAF1773615.1 hypothetical protein NRS6094_04061 [Bacillus subtilis]